MDAEDRRWYKQETGKTLAEATYNPKKIILIYTGAMLALSALVTLISFFLEKEIGETGGLGGLGTRGILTTLQTVLQLLPMILLPFWQAGYTAVTLRIARRKEFGWEDLLEGFRKFFPVLRLLLLNSLIYFLILSVTSQLGTMAFMMTPWAAPFMDAIMAFVEDPGNAALEAAMNEAAVAAAVPLLSITGAVFLALAAPFFYKFRCWKIHFFHFSSHSRYT